MQEEKDLFDEFPDEITPPTRRPRATNTPTFPRPMRWRLWVLVAFGAFALLVWPAWAAFYTDWLWFQELGFQSVFSTVLTTKLISGLGGGIIAAVLFWINLKIALRLSGAEGQAGYQFYIGTQQIAVADLGKLITRLSLPLAGLMGAFIGAQSWNAWDIFLQYRYGVPFGAADPILGHDIGYYFFRLPLLDFVTDILQWLIIFCFIAAIIIYLSRAALGIHTNAQTGQTKISIIPAPRAHLLILVALFFLTLAARTYLDLPGLLLSSGNTVAGASYSDIHATMPILWAKIFVALLVVILALGGIFLQQLKFVVAGIALYGLTILAGFIYPASVQKFSVAPNELERESPYLAHSIAATRKAYNLDHVEERELAGDAPLTAKDIQDNRRTINGIRLWDQDQLLSTFAQLQELRPYYSFKNVDNDRYKINGETQQVMLSVREMESEQLPNRNWINERFIFTHGYGVTLGSVSQITSEGFPVLYVKDIPPVTTIPNLKMERPEIYFGEMANEHVYVKTKQQELDYPQGDENKFTTYQGNGGVLVNSYLRKLMFATRFGELKLMLSNDVTNESRVLFYRNIKDRLEQIAPFLTFDRDPYLVISEGKGYWLCDGYTTSNRYPYSQRVILSNRQEINYIRNSVKAVVDAYSGAVQLYIADDNDPLIKTYANIFPGILKPLTEMPADLRSHLRYPEDIFRIQTRVYATYHMDQPQVFYNKEDQWEIASSEVRDNTAVPMEPYYTILKLPNASAEEFLVMLPFVPKNKLNLASWMVARCDGENYGKLLIYRIPKQKQIFGPKQIVGRITQDAEISGQITLWDQRGSKVIFGTMLVIPVKESLLYVQPLYLQSETAKIPELKRVIVVNENRIAMGENLEQSLTKLFGNGAVQQQAPTDTQASTAPAPTQTLSPAQTALAAEALQHDDRAAQALREGDWARYGDERKKVRALLEQLAKTK